MNKFKLSLIAFLVSVFIFSSTDAVAQEIPRHELSLSYGYAPATQIFGYFGTTIITFGIFNAKMTSTTGAINLSYGYRINKVVSLGAVYSFTAFSENQFLIKEFIGSSDYSFHSFGPMAKFNWYSPGIVSLYSRIGVGVAFGSIKQFPKEQQNQPTTISKSRTAFAFQGTPIGIEIGRQVAGFAEVGIGTMGSVIAGIRARF